MKQKIIDILQPNMIDEVAELKADQIMELFKIEMKKHFGEIWFDENGIIDFENWFKTHYEITKQNCKKNPLSRLL